MDSASWYALSYSIFVILAVGVMLFMTRPPASSMGTGLTSPISFADATQGVQRYGGILGMIVPYALMGISPMIDLYYREFKYSILTVIGAASVLIGYVYQYVLRGSSAFLPALTVATSAIVSFLVYDVWVQGTGKIYTFFATILGLLVIGGQVATNPSTTIFASKTTNDIASVGLGLALGALSWMIVWNSDKKYLFQTKLGKKETVWAFCSQNCPVIAKA